MATVKIRHAGFVYNKRYVGIGTDGKKTESWHPVMAQRNEVVDTKDMHETDLEHGREIGAFWTSEHDPETGVPLGFNINTGQFDDSVVEMSDDLPDIDESNDEELAEWVQGATVKAVVDLAGDNPDHAARLLEAEEAASGRDPRATLVKALEKIVGE